VKRLTVKVVAGQTINGTKGVIDNSFVEPVYFVIDPSRQCV